MKHARGFTIIEFMIAMTLSLLVLAALTATFVANSRSRTEIEKANRLAHSYRDTDKNLGSGALFSSGINMTGTAGAGLLLALLLFVVYWVAAAASFFVLRQYRLVKHAWVAFAACAAIFTIAAWGSVFKVTEPEALLPEARALARQIAQKPRDVVRFAKQALNHIDPSDLHRNYRLEQGYTYQLNIMGTGARQRDAFVRGERLVTR